MSLLDPRYWSGQLYSEGWREAPGCRDIVSPATGRKLGVAGLAGTADVERAVRSAAARAEQWAALPFAERVAILDQAATVLRRNHEEIADWAIRETGAVRRKAEHEISLA